MKISINLLPSETIAEEAKRSRFYKIQFIGVAIILVLIFLSSLTLALQILQQSNRMTVQAKLIESEQKIENLKDTQVSLFLLKNRLNVIGQYLGIPSKQSSVYRLINKLMPPSVAISSISVDKKGTVVLLAISPDKESLDQLINNLTNNETNEKKIEEVSIESLHRSKDGLFRINLKITPK